MESVIGRGIGDIKSKLADIMQYVDAVLAANTYTLDVANRAVRNFRLSTVPDIAQVETATAAGTVTANPGGDATVTVTSAGMTGSPKVVSVPLLLNDDANAIATKIRAALTADAVINAKFVVSGATDKVILTARAPAANDTTLNIAIATGTATGVTAAASSANTTAGGIAAKTIAFSNVPTETEVLIELTSTEAAAITWPAGITWLSGQAPALTAGKKYRILFFTVNGGTAWQAVSVGGW